MLLTLFMGLCVWSIFCYAVLSVLSSFAIISSIMSVAYVSSMPGPRKVFVEGPTLPTFF